MDSDTDDGRDTDTSKHANCRRIGFPVVFDGYQEIVYVAHTYVNGFRVGRRMSCLSIVSHVAISAHRFISSPTKVFLDCFISWVWSSAEWYVYVRCKYESLLGWQLHGPKPCRFSLGLTLFLRNHSIKSPWAPNQPIPIQSFPVLH